MHLKTVSSFLPFTALNASPFSKQTEIHHVLVMQVDGIV